MDGLGTEEGESPGEQQESSAEQDLSRVPPHLRDYVYKPGQSGNPRGRPKGTGLTDRLRRLLFEEDDGLAADLLVANLTEAAKANEPWAIKALAMVFDRVEGPVKQEIDATVRTDVTNLHLGASPTNPPPMPGGEDDAGGD